MMPQMILLYIYKENISLVLGTKSLIYPCLFSTSPCVLYVYVSGMKVSKCTCFVSCILGHIQAARSFTLGGGGQLNREADV